MASKTTKLTSAKVRVAALAGGFVALLIIVAAQSWLTGSTQTVINTVASTVLALSLVSFAYELFFRRDLRDEILELVGLERDLADSQIKKVTRYSEINWNLLFDSAGDVAAISLEPSLWIQINRNLIEEQFSSGRSSLRLYIPDPEAEYIKNIAARLNVEVENYRSQLEDSVDLMEALAKRLEPSIPAKAGYAIGVFILSEPPSYSIYQRAPFSILTTPVSCSRANREDDMALLFDGSVSQYPSSWFKAQFEACANANPKFFTEF